MIRHEFCFTQQLQQQQKQQQQHEHKVNLLFVGEQHIGIIRISAIRKF